MLRRRSIAGRWTAVLAAFLVCAAALAFLPMAPAGAAPESPRPGSRPIFTSSGSARTIPLARLGDPAAKKSTVWLTTGRSPVGKWVRWKASKATRIDRVQVVAARGSQRFTAGVLDFSDGSRIRVHADRDGKVQVRFAARFVRWVKLTISKVPRKVGRVALSRFVVTGPPASTTRSVAAAATASVDGRVVPALTDARGFLGRGTGSAWEASRGGKQEIRLTWTQAVSINAVQVYGSPTATGSAPSGEIRSDPGGAVPMLPVAAGNAGPTSVAFPSRTVRSLTIELTPRPGERLDLREVAAFAPGDVPPAFDGGSGPSISNRLEPATSCAAAVASPSVGLRLICPSTGAAVTGPSTIVVAAPSGSRVTADAVLVSGSTATVSSASVSDGTARLAFDAAQLPGGPVVIRVRASGVRRALYVELFNRSRAAARPAASPSAAGRTLVFDDDFSAPLSISANGAGARYAATKPASWGNSEFGDAVFANPVTHKENLSTVDDRYLRIRATPLAAGEKDPTGWGRRSRGGILASASVPGGGFGAQYGYFEARMLAPASPGTWPAFWMMSSSFLRDSSSSTNSEIDAVELYGQDSSYSCHSWHDWLGVAGKRGGAVDCVHALPDWAMTWHTYGVDVSKTGLKYYIDGKLVSTAPRTGDQAEPFYFLLDLSLGGGWPIDLSGVNGVADLYVDYVRVYV